MMSPDAEIVYVGVRDDRRTDYEEYDNKRKRSPGVVLLSELARHVRNRKYCDRYPRGKEWCERGSFWVLTFGKRRIAILSSPSIIYEPSFLPDGGDTYTNVQNSISASHATFDHRQRRAV
jgi:hypothetical protein